jgi:hypothetical protein
MKADIIGVEETNALLAEKPAEIDWFGSCDQLAVGESFQVLMPFVDAGRFGMDVSEQFGRSREFFAHHTELGMTLIVRTK